MATFNVALTQDDNSPSAALVLLRPRLAPGRGVCRSLFGPVDHDELRSELKRQLKEIQASDCQRWNFDFEAGTPLKGTFCWEPLESKETPSLYRESRLCPNANTTTNATTINTTTSTINTTTSTINTTTPVPRPPPQQQQQSRLAPDTREEAPAGSVSPKCSKENADKTVRRCQGVKGPSKTTTQLRKREISTAITDYFPKRKRLQITKTDTFKVVNSFCTLEQTPRKKIR